MPNHGKGGRPPEREAPKRAAVAVRTTPALKARLEAAATEAGRSVTQEIEARLEASLDFKWDGLDVRTQELFVEIARDIRRAEEINGGKRWHKDLRTWAMAREALATGEIDRQCPPLDSLFSGGDGSYSAELVRELNRYRAELRSLALASGELGYSVPLNPLGWVDVSEPVYLYDEKWDEQIAHGFDPPHKEAILSLMGKMKQLEAERLPIAEDYKVEQAGIIEAIDKAVADWKADRESKGIYRLPEYRPPPEYQPIRAPNLTGVWTKEGDKRDPFMDKRLSALKAKKTGASSGPPAA